MRILGVEVDGPIDWGTENTLKLNLKRIWFENITDLSVGEGRNYEWLLLDIHPAYHTALTKDYLSIRYWICYFGDFGMIWSNTVLAF